jgi:hypothetical protein
MVHPMIWLQPRPHSTLPTKAPCCCCKNQEVLSKTILPGVSHNLCVLGLPVPTVLCYGAHVPNFLWIYWMPAMSSLLLNIVQRWGIELRSGHQGGIFPKAHPPHTRRATISWKGPNSNVFFPFAILARLLDWDELPSNVLGKKGTFSVCSLPLSKFQSQYGHILVLQGWLCETQFVPCT